MEVPKRARLADSKEATLPHELLLEIFFRLPAPAILRARGVCKLWRALTSTPCFVDEFLARAAEKDPSILAVSLGSLSCDFSLYSSVRDRPGHQKFGPAAFMNEPPLAASNPCNGLVCLALHGSNELWVVNPITSDSVRLPPLRAPGFPSLRYGVPRIGLGFSASAKQYTVAVIFPRENHTFGCKVFTLGARSWRSIGDAPRPVCGNSPVLFGGAIIWAGRSVAVSLDLEEGRFKEIPHPDTGYHPSCSLDPQVIELGGRLCFASSLVGESRIDIWELKDWSNGGWEKKDSVVLGAPDCGTLRLAPSLKAIWERKVLVLSSDRWLYFYDRRSNAMERVELGLMGVVHPFVESLVSPSYISGARRPRKRGAREKGRRAVW